MSRHLLSAHNPTHEVCVGYDVPLDNYFGHVYNLAAAEDEDNVLYSEWGTHTPEALAASMARYTTVPYALLVTLYAERDQGRAHLNWNQTIDHREETAA